MIKFKGKNFLLNLRIFWLVIFLMGLGLFFSPALIFAQTRFSYPIAELGYCRDAKECYLYCEIPKNKAACWSYGKYIIGAQVLGKQETDEQTVGEKLQALGITFPIAELGNCNSVSECHQYCEEPAHHGACTSFARKHGLHKAVEQKKEALLEKAKEELGCTSLPTCRAFCDRPENHKRCGEFATRHGIHQAAGVGLDKKKLLEKAREELGCDSLESCRQFCEQKPQLCHQFAKKHGFDKKIRQNIPFKGIPGKCSTPKQCERYCSEHEEECRRYFKSKRPGEFDTRERDFPGPGGCQNEEACRAYCSQHPDECAGFGDKDNEGDGSVGRYVGQSGCRTVAECKAFCQKHPDECPGFKQSSDYLRFLQGEYRSKDRPAVDSFELSEEERKKLIEESQQYYQKNTEEFKEIEDQVTDEQKKEAIELLKKICQENNCAWEDNSCRCR